MDRFTNLATLSGAALEPLDVTTLQVNVTRLCNQACRHCHVDASPARTEQMSGEVAEAVLGLLERLPQAALDITGGAPELNPHFERLVTGARALERHVMVRHNLTVTFDGHPVTGASMRHLPEFFAANAVEVVCSLPYYKEFFTDRQRGSGVFRKSIAGLRALNEAGYARPGTGLVLSLVYNPVGAFLPPSERSLEDEYRRELRDRWGIAFDRLFALTNMPIHRFRDDLERRGTLQDYMARLQGAFNAEAAEAVMCRSLVSVSHDGRLFDCDFNQMLGLDIDLEDQSRPTVFDVDPSDLLRRRIRFGDHCLGCAAGQGSSCTGAAGGAGPPIEKGPRA